jgi:hypothetical protein
MYVAPEADAKQVVAASFQAMQKMKKNILAKGRIIFKREKSKHEYINIILSSKKKFCHLSTVMWERIGEALKMVYSAYQFGETWC